MTATTTTPTVSRIVLTNTNLTTAMLEKLLEANSVNGKIKAARLNDMLVGAEHRDYPLTMSFNLGATCATGTITISSTGPTNSQTFTIGGVTFTGKTSSVAQNEYTVSTTPATAAKNIAAAINLATNVKGLVTATSALGVVTLTAVVPGIIGNKITIDAGTSSNTAMSSTVLASGAEGDAFTVDLS